MARRDLNGTVGHDWINATLLPPGDYARSYLGTGNDGFEGSSGDDEASGEDGNDVLLGNAGMDRLFGGAGNDQIYGGIGNDMLDGGDDDDFLDGGDGRDTLIGGNGHDQLYGGAGDDLLQGGEGNNVLIAGTGNDTINAGAGNDLIEGGDGHDAINGGGGNNTIYGGAGNDRMTAGDGNDLISGDDGNDIILAGNGDNSVFGGVGNDSLTSGTGNDSISGGDGSDTINAGSGNNYVDAGSGNDRIVTGNGNDLIEGGAGNDIIAAGDGNNHIYAGAHDDSITAGNGNDFFDGGDGNDTITSASGDDSIYGGAGNDRLTTGNDDDFIDGGSGSDVIQAGHGNNMVYGGADQDSVITGDGTDWIDGGTGRDTIFGGAGNDTIYGGDQNDELTGATGRDMVDAGAGHDLVLQGRNDGNAGLDHLIGGSGFDTLRLSFALNEWVNAANQTELARLLVANGTPAAQGGAPIVSNLFGLKFQEFEALSALVNGVVLTVADDPVDAINDFYTVSAGATVTGNVTANDVVPDLVASVMRTSAPPPMAAAFSLSNTGLMSFDTGNAFAGLAAGQTQDVSFTYRVRDADGDQDFAVATIRVTGVNDAASISGVASGSVVEDGALVTGGTLTVTDVDSGETSFATPASLTGSYGSFSFNSGTGVWGYTLNNALSAVQALGAGSSLTDSLTVASLDGTATRVIIVTINGANDAPTLANAIANQAAAEGDAFSFTLPGNVFTDVDAADTRDLSATLDGGGALPAWLSFNATTGTFSGTPGSNDQGTLSVRVTATDGQGASVSDVFDIAVADTPAPGLVADFEALPSDGGTPVTSYLGFSWINLYVVDGPNTYPASGYDVGQNGDRVGYNGFASPLTISRALDFDFERATFTAAWNNQTMYVDAYDDGFLVGTQAIAITTTASATVLMDDALFDSVDTVIIRSPIFTHIAMDDLLFYV